MFASGFVASSPSSAKAFGTFWSSFKKSGKTAKIRAAKEMSLVTMSIFDDAVNDFMIGSNERVANAGASSVLV